MEGGGGRGSTESPNPSESVPIIVWFCKLLYVLINFHFIAFGSLYYFSTWFVGK